MQTLRKIGARLRSRFPVPEFPRGRFRIACVLAVMVAAGISAPRAFAQGTDAPVGRIEGDDISVRGEVQVARENGHTFTSLGSGSQVTVRSGRARVELAGGGEIGICGPARFSLVRAGASLTLALDYGRVRARVANPEDLRIYTPQIAASPIAGADRADDINVGLESSGKMCVRAASGALRLEPQFGGESLVVPQGMEATLEGGQLSGLAATAKACGCDALEAKRESDTRPATSVSQITLSPNAPPAAPPNEQDSAKKSPETPPPSAPGEQPIWKVYMSPLTFNASPPGPTATPPASVTMPPPSPATAMLFREVYVEPVIVWRGEVEAPAAAAANAKAAPAPANAAAKPAKKSSVGARLAGFFRRLFGGKPKTEQQSAAGSALTQIGRGAAPAGQLLLAESRFGVFHSREGGSA